MAASVKEPVTGWLHQLRNQSHDGCIS